MKSTREFSFMQKAAAWGVHGFTLSGLVVGIFAIMHLLKGEYNFAAINLAVAVLIDMLDGSFARFFKVSEALPNVNGALISLLVRIFTWTLTPAVFLILAHHGTTQDPGFLISGSLKWVAFAGILISSGYYYFRKKDRLHETWETGFPPAWNLVVFYLYYLTRFSEIINLAIILLVIVLQFIPLKIPVPTRHPVNKALNRIAAIVFIFSIIGILFAIERGEQFEWLKNVSYGCLGYFTLVSLWTTFSTGKQDH